MPWFDLPLERLREFRTETIEPPELDRWWYLRPAGANGPRTVGVKFIGYGGGRGLPTEHTLLPALGYSVFVMDTRGQGGRWTSGATGPENAQVMSRGHFRDFGEVIHG